MSKNMNVPKLRFSEFSGEWEEKKFRDITIKIGSGSTPLGGEKIYTEEGILFIRSQNVNNDKLELLDKTFIPSDIHNKMKGSKVFPNDVLLNITGASIGRSCVVPDNITEANVNQHVCIVRGDSSLNSNFLQTFISSSKGQKLISQGQTGSGREGLNFQSIASFKLHLADIKEQEKIASFLSSIDAKIEQLTKKESLLQEYKKGVMQKIFNQEIRFSPKWTSSQAQGDADDGSEFCDWEEKTLDEIVNRYDNLRIPISSSNRIPGNTPYYGANGIQDHVQGFTHDGEFVLLAEDGANDLKNYPIQYVNGRIWVNNHAHVLQAKKNIANNRFLKYSFSKINIEPFLVGGGRAKLNANIMMKINTLLPSLEEQTKIANFLSSIDKKIENTKTQLEKTKEFKKALLQQMFV